VSPLRVFVGLWLLGAAVFTLGAIGTVIVVGISRLWKRL
jgi:hypothetical protein